MKVQLEHILQNLFHKPSLEEVNVDELQEMVKEHPYFSAGHFLLAQKLKQQDTEQYELQAQRTALYFHDPLWLQWQLKEFSKGNGSEAEIEEPVKEEEIIVEEDEIVKPAEEEEQPLEPQEQLAVETIGPVEEAIPAEPETEYEPELEIESESEPKQHTATIEPDQPKPSEPSQPIIQTEDQKPLAFDPYYTIDYFASQGIKAPVDVQPGDKLGKQLKSFTEWLKTMKRLPQTEPGDQTEREQQHIRQFAAGSLEQKEVVTETMADVLVKQGRNAEAIAIYDKLSLLDPSKSAYFAAKIENLKAN